MTPQTSLAPAFAQSTTLVAEPGLPKIEHFTFNGSGSEYFRIWVVNLLLTIVTLGIYSAWAKVRKLRYFYGSTRVAGSSFDYYGDPIAILKGRLIAVALIIVYNMVSEYSMTASLIMLVPLALVIPWLLWKSLQFKLYNSSYRGIRFGFRGSAGKAYWNYLGWFLLCVLSLGLLVPLAHQRIKQFQHTESRFGATYFSFDATAGNFYRAYLIALLVAVGAGFALSILTSVIAGWGVPRTSGQWLTLFVNPDTLIIFALAVYLSMLLLVPLFMTLIQNLIWNHTRLQGHQFTCDMTWGRTAFIMVTNLLGIIFTLGLYTPFAQVRMMKYRMESMTIVPAGSLNDFVADAKANTSASSEGLADLLDFDLSL